MVRELTRGERARERDNRERWAEAERGGWKKFSFVLSCARE